MTLLTQKQQDQLDLDMAQLLGFEVFASKPSSSFVFVQSPISGEIFVVGKSLRGDRTPRWQPTVNISQALLVSRTFGLFGSAGDEEENPLAICLEALRFKEEGGMCD